MTDSGVPAKGFRILLVVLALASLGIGVFSLASSAATEPTTVVATSTSTPGPTTSTVPGPTTSTTLGTTTTLAGQKVTICHKPGTPAEETLSVGAPAVPAHLAHGDTLGPCTTVPTTSTTVPQTTSTVPQTTSTVPQTTSTVPQTTSTSVPQTTTSAP